MQSNEKERLHVFRVRKFPILLGGVTGLFFIILGNSASMFNYKILANFGELMLVVSVFLLLIFIFDAIKMRYRILADRNRDEALGKAAAEGDSGGKQRSANLKKNRAARRAAKSGRKEDASSGSDMTLEKRGRRSPSLFKRFGKKRKEFEEDLGEYEGDEFSARQETQEETIEPELDVATETPSVIPSSFVEIKKEDDVSTRLAVEKRSEDKFNFYLSVFYIILLVAGAVWCVIRIIPVINSLVAGNVPLYATESYSLVTSLIFVAFSCVAVIYLKIRKDNGTQPCDKTSNDLLTLLSYSSLAYAAVIAVNSILGFGILVVLPWVYCAILAYLVIAVVVNILLSLLKHEVIGAFNYAFVPSDFVVGEDNESVLDSEEVRSKVSLKSLWTIKYTLRILPGLVLLLGFVMILSTTIYVVQPHQQAVVCRFGTASEETVVDEGIHFKLPWPIDEVHIYDVDRINSMQIGYSSTNTKDFIWGLAHDGGEYLLLLGTGNEVAAVNMKVNYKIDDVYAYFRTYTKPEDVLSAAAYEAIMRRSVDTTLDVFLSIDRSSFSDSLTDELKEFCKENNLGITVTQIIVQGIHPPIDVASVYQKVVTASVDKESLITNAKTEAERLIIDAEQQHQEAINAATADQYTRVSSAKEEMTVYYSSMEAYNVNPECFELTKYIEAYETIINGRKVYVFSPGTEDNISRFVIGKPATVIPVPDVQVTVE